MLNRTIKTEPVSEIKANEIEGSPNGDFDPWVQQWSNENAIEK